MTDEATESVTVTDAQVDHFFDNGGVFEEAPEKVEKAEVKEAPTEAPTQEPEKDDKSENKVNYGALHEERQRRKAEAERAKKAEERAEELERRIKQYEQPKQPDINDDPLEALRKETEQLKSFLTVQAKAALADKETTDYWSRVAESEKAFKQDKPEFDDAMNFLAKTRLEELADLGWNETEARKVLSDEIKWISDKAYEDEVNPAERFWNLANRRGFKAENPTEEKAETPKENSADLKLKSIEKGQQANRALPPASKSVKQDLTAEALADMKVDALSNLQGDTDFDKAWNKLFGA